VTFREWKDWLSELPWLLRWFPVLVLLRPVIDNLYFLKEVSPLLSPPYLAGVITPVFCIAALIRFRFPPFNSLDRIFAWLGAMLLFSTFMLLLFDPLSLVTIEFVLKLSMPVYLYFFLRLLLRDLRDLHGVLQSVLYSAIIVASILLFEVLINPVRLEESRGLMRIQGGFGDVVSYGMYIVFSAIIASYFYFSRQHIFPRRKLHSIVAVVALLSVLGLINIHHTASYTIFLIILGLFLVYNFRTQNSQLALSVIIICGLAFTLWGSTIIEEKLTPLVATDLAVYSGEKETDQLFHGRMGRWRLMLEKFSTEPVHVQMFGMPLRFAPVYPFIGVGSHNDFFRIMFSVGIAGLFVYLLLLAKVFLLGRKLGIAQRFLLYSTLLAILFFSISVTPTFYPPFLYFMLTVMVYAGLSANDRLSWNGHVY
jgi:hypothetical protein